MKINWFPGHMAKALRLMQEQMKRIDIILYTIDARAPISCINPKFIEVVGNKPIIFIINKCDLVDANEIKKFENKFKWENSSVFFSSAINNISTKKLISEIEKMLSAKREKFLNKGAFITLRGMIIGVPNSGKSTLINSLAPQKKAITGNKPGVTKANSWVKIIKGLEIMDTPGTLWPNLDNESVATNLALINSIKDELLDKRELACELIGIIKKKYPLLLNQRYKIDCKIDEMDNYDILLEIGNSRGYKVKGGDVDDDRASEAIIREFRMGQIGKIILDEII